MPRVNIITGLIKASMSPALLRTGDTLSSPQVDVEVPVTNRCTRRHLVTNFKALMTPSCYRLHPVFNHSHCSFQNEGGWFKWRMCDR